MKKSIVMLVMVGLVSSLSMPAFAIKQLNDKFVEIYGSEADRKGRASEAAQRQPSKKLSATSATLGG